MMKSRIFLATSIATLVLSGCGYKGNLYLPKKDDKAQFGVIQTGLQLDTSKNIPHKTPLPQKNQE